MKFCDPILNAAMAYGKSQTEYEFPLSLFSEEEDYADLKAYLREHSIFEKVSELDAAFDPHAVAETLRHSQIVFKVADEATQFGKEAVHIAFAILVRAWVQKRNEKKKDKIEVKVVEPLFFEQHGHRLSIRPASKVFPAVWISVSSRSTS